MSAAPSATAPYETPLATTAAEDQLIAGVLAGCGRPPVPARPTVVFAYPGHGVGERHRELSGCTNQLLLLSTAVDRMTRLGVDVLAVSTEPPRGNAHLTALRGRIASVSEADALQVPHLSTADGVYLRRRTYLLRPGMAPVAIGAITDSVAHTEAVLDELEQERIRGWAAQVWPEHRGKVTVAAFHANGADSDGIVRLRGAGEAVAKVGAAGVVGAEAAFLVRVNETAARAGIPALFPAVHRVLTEDDQAVCLMEAVEPATLDESLFADEDRFVPLADAMRLLEPYLTALTALHRATAGTAAPQVGPYLYRDRFSAVVDHPGFVSSFQALAPVDATVAQLLAARLRLPGGRVVQSYDEQRTWLADVADRLVPETGALTHGDPHLRNLLGRADGTPVFVDPRTVWDGRITEDAGYGDPAYDFATLLHSVFPMSGLLRAIETGRVKERFPQAAAAPRDGVLDLSHLRLPFELPPAAADLERDLLGRIGHPAAAARLSVGAANALAGWLKYARSLGTGEAWLAVYAYTLWFLDRARRSVAA